MRHDNHKVHVFRLSPSTMFKAVRDKQKSDFWSSRSTSGGGPGGGGPGGGRAGAPPANHTLHGCSLSRVLRTDRLVDEYQFKRFVSFRVVSQTIFYRNEAERNGFQYSSIQNETTRNETDFNMLVFKTKRHETKRYILGTQRKW